MLKTYFLDPKKLAHQVRGIVLLYTITGVIAMIAIFVTQRMAGNSDLPWLAIAVIPLLIAFTGGRSIRQRKELWEHYSLTLQDELLIQSQPDYPDAKIALSSVTGMQEAKDGLFLSSNQSTRAFGIPRQLKDEDYQELRLMLQKLVARHGGNTLIDEETEADTSTSLPTLESEEGASAVISEAEGMDEYSKGDL